jgi:hypothetical protein
LKSLYRAGYDISESNYINAENHINAIRELKTVAEIKEYDKLAPRIGEDKKKKK